jgi:hypothetical protein
LPEVTDKIREILGKKVTVVDCSVEPEQVFRSHLSPMVDANCKVDSVTATDGTLYIDLANGRYCFPIEDKVEGPVSYVLKNGYVELYSRAISGRLLSRVFIAMGGCQCVEHAPADCAGHHHSIEAAI